MDYTNNLHLPQFVASDRIHHDDFNAAFAAIDTAVFNALPAIGSYVGNGKTSAEGGQRIELGFRPRAIIISAGWTSISTTGNLQRMYIYLPTCLSGYLYTTENGFTVHATNSTTNGSPNLNQENVYYGYLALR